MNGELSDPLCDSVNRGLTLVRLVLAFYQQQMFSMLVPVVCILFLQLTGLVFICCYTLLWYLKYSSLLYKCLINWKEKFSKFLVLSLILPIPQRPKYWKITLPPSQRKNIAEKAKSKNIFENLKKKALIENLWTGPFFYFDIITLFKGR